MPAELPVVIAVAGEDRGHFETTTRLADRRIGEQVAWTAEFLEHVRRWLHDGERPWFDLHRSLAAARSQRLPIKGLFAGESGMPDAKMIRAQLLSWAELVRRGVRIDAVVLVRDLDGRPERLQGMRQAVRTGSWPFVVLVAWCEPEVEAWKVGCFVPEDDAERARFASLAMRLSFNPTAEPERLHSAVTGSQRDAKKIARELFDGDAERGWRCLELPFEQLRVRGGTTGLADFLKQVDEKLVPLVAAGQPS